MIIRRECTSSKIKRLSAKLSSLFVGPAEVKKKVGINTYLVKMKRGIRKYTIQNLINLYPYKVRESTKKIGKVES